jgi:D-alanyl-D-alanine carboxypeptidase/D-alanyl-D-alanine-endopeptidase (penicillin-binding protein 4)
LTETSERDELRGGSSRVRPGSRSLTLALAATWLAFASTCPAGASSSCVPYGLLSDSLATLRADVVNGCHFGILAISLDRGDTLLALNPGDRFIPASNMKLFVTGAFLRFVGPTARGVTAVSAGGKLSRKKDRIQEVKGDLILHASGYPDIVQLLHPGSRGLLDSLAWCLHESGLRKVRGTVWIDGTIFAPEPYGPGWAIDDLPFSYGAPLNAVLSNGNAATLLATATPKGVRLSLDPPETPLRVVGHVTLSEPGAMPVLSITREPGSHVLRVTGRIPPDTSAKRQISVPDPDSTAGLVFLGAMKRAGIDARARVAVVPPGGVAPPETAMLVRLESPPASEVVSMVDAYSLNAETEALLRQLDPASSGKSAGPALRRLTAMLAEAGVDTLDLSFVDGSGLSPLNLATPRAFIRWLEFLSRDPVLGAIFRGSLASPGAVGTLQKRFASLQPGVQVNAKSGTLTNVSGLSGYLTTEGGERVAFSILSNGNRGSVSAAHAAEEEIVTILSGLRRSPTAAETAPQYGPRMIPR